MNRLLATLFIAAAIGIALYGLIQVTLFWMIISDMDSMETPYYCEKSSVEYQCSRDEYNALYFPTPMLNSG